MGKPLTEQQFNTIKAQLRKKSNEIAKVAEASGLKVSTIKAVRRMENWKQYQALRKAQGEKIKALHELDKITKSGQIAKGPGYSTEAVVKGLNKLSQAAKAVGTPTVKSIKVRKPGSTSKRRNAKASKSATQIQTEAFGSMSLQVVSLTERVVTLEVAVRKLQHDAIKSDIQERRTFMARFRKGSK